MKHPELTKDMWQTSTQLGVPVFVVKYYTSFVSYHLPAIIQNLQKNTLKVHYKMQKTNKTSEIVCSITKQTTIHLSKPIIT